MSRARTSLVGAGIGVAAGALTTVGVVADHLRRGRRTAVRLGSGLDELTEVADAERVVIADDGVTLHVEIDEPRAAVAKPLTTVVLTHGYTHDHGLWVYQRRTLRDAGYRVVLWDLRGHGRSGEGEGSAYTVRQLGRDLARVLDEVTPTGTVVLVGHSMGGMAVMSLAGARPELFGRRVIGVGLISTTAGDLASVDLGFGRRVAAVVHRLGPAAMTRLAARRALLDAARATGREVEEFLVHRYAFASAVPLAVVRLTADMIFRTRLEVVGAFFEHLREHDETTSLATLAGVETLVMHGMRDRVLPSEHGERIVQAIPGCAYVQVEHAGHVLPLEYPEVVGSELLDLVGRARRAAAPRRRRARPVRTVVDVVSRRRARQAARSGGSPGPRVGRQGASS